MARREARFTCCVKLEREFTVIPHLLQAGFRLQIRKFLKDDNGNVQEALEESSQEKFFLPEFAFGCNGHHILVTYRLREAGWHQSNLQRILDAAFSEAKLILERERSTCGIHIVPTIVFCVNKFVRWEDELEARALELSMQEVPKTVPATKESIQALKKVKLEGDNTEKCMICMEQLISSGTDKMITSMPCSHLFHGDCIEKWLNTSHKCPLCRFPMPTDG
ncbi:E3 ubiquitin-protein ligase SGR9, amyloplastic-like [Herrania umbratica]|uniref:RING-type E3 ubiquitin transferase n=1 Tax=Herrania umbratica TaxID=108875 RepID=A0A6J1BMQ4_9ROSI|nr:E3 ubiquitin-protein ligase SGR9, amyloplastic-like [Herrania umbratica]